MKRALPLLLALATTALAGTDVRTLGLKADGATDDTASLQAALDAGHTDLNFSAGEYLLGTVLLPAETRLVFDRQAKIKVNAAGITSATQRDPGNAQKRKRAGECLFEIVGDRVRIEGIRFDFASGGTDKEATPVNLLFHAENVSDVTITDAYVEASLPRELVPLAKRDRGSSPWKPKEGGPKQKHGDTQTLLRAENCHNVVLENSGATFISIMLEALGCENVTARGNWMLHGVGLTVFSAGSGSLRHFDNWSRDVTSQAVWRGGSPDPSRKAPQVPKGTANVVVRGVKSDDPAYIPHTAGVYDVIVRHNYADYGNTLCWGNKCRDVIIEGNIARFISDYSYGTEGGQNVTFANNISINSTSGGIVSMYWGENLLITGNQILVRHEPWDSDYSRYPKPSSYLGGFVRLHHGPSNPEDRYGAGTVLISNNLFDNELATVAKGIGGQAGRDVTIAGNKFINGVINKSGEEHPGESKLVVTGNEFIIRLPFDPVCINTGFHSAVSMIRDNIFRKEKPTAAGALLEQASEKDAVPYLLFTEKPKDDDEEKEPAHGPAISINESGEHFAAVQNNVIQGWKEAVKITGGRKFKSTAVITGNTTNGAIVYDDPSNRVNRIEQGNITLPAE